MPKETNPTSLQCYQLLSLNSRVSHLGTNSRLSMPGRHSTGYMFLKPDIYIAGCSWLLCYLACKGGKKSFKWTLALIWSNGLRNLLCLLQCDPGFVNTSEKNSEKKPECQTDLF